MVVFRGNAGLLQRRFHHICIISQGILLTTHEIGRWEVLVVFRGERCENIAVFWIDFGVSIEDFHRLLVDDRDAFFVVLVRCVDGSILFGHIVPVESARNNGGNTFDHLASLLFLHKSVGDLQGECTAS